DDEWAQYSTHQKEPGEKQAHPEDALAEVLRGISINNPLAQLDFLSLLPILRTSLGKRQPTASAEKFRGQMQQRWWLRAPDDKCSGVSCQETLESLDAARGKERTDPRATGGYEMLWTDWSQTCGFHNCERSSYCYRAGGNSTASQSSDTQN
ncbi:hypothetical protein STEG23_022254, partial [Scotinomys teguina]